jgi:natural product biosynthesis luciferase-like monooxygenase protein
VLAVDDGLVEVATAGRRLRLTGLGDADGGPLTAAALRARGIEPGRALPRPDPRLRGALAEFDAAVARSEGVWVRRLVERAPTPLGPLDGVAPAVAPASCAIDVPNAAAAALAACDGERRAAAWLAALSVVVSRLGGADTVHLEVDAGAVPDALAPFYATRVPVRVAVAGADTAGALVEAAGRELAVVGRHRSYARDAVARYAALRGRRDAGDVGAPVVAFLRAGSATASATLALRVADDGLGAEVVLGVGDGLMAAGVAARVATVLDALLAAPDRPAAAIAATTAAEQALLLGAWNATAAPFRDDACVHELFEEQAARTPDRVAVRFGDEALTYAALNRRANEIAGRLRAAGVGPGALVGVCVDRSAEMVAGLLGVLKAGAAYVPMDPAYPRERLATMLEDARPRAVLTERRLADRVAGAAAVLHLDAADAPDDPRWDANVPSGAAPEGLAYVIFTSGSTGRPKGVMVTHRNVANFFAGMDRTVGPAPGVWLAVTSISFDISVLELFWTLTRGFAVVVQPAGDRASVGARAAEAGAAGQGEARPGRMGFGLFYFAADAARPADAYRLLVEGAKFADTHGFDAVWTPERHFHAFGGLYPNAAVTSAALATVTSRVQLRAGSVVLPLHDPIRVAEEWAVVDNLSGGRVGLSFASGWHADDFALKPENYARRREVMAEHIATVRRLWRGESVRVVNGEGREVEVRTQPRPVQADPPLWVASAGSVETFRAAGRMGVNVLTNLLGQSTKELREKVAAYREARRAAGHAGDGVVTVMLHTLVGPDTEAVRRLVREPFTRYLATSVDLVKSAPWSFPAFRAPSGAGAQELALDAGAISPEDMQALLDHAFDRYFETAGLFGTPEKARTVVAGLAAIGVNEVACLVDFGVEPDVVLAHLPYLKQLMDASQAGADAPAAAPSVGAALTRYGVTHLQCTPSQARMLAADPDAEAGLRRLDRLLLGGEALPADLADAMARLVPGQVLNMYGPTETTVWSTVASVRAGEEVTIGRPIANTVVRLLDAERRLVPVGATGELHIGGAGVTDGYLHRPELTAERFVDDPYAPGARLYRTGDLAQQLPDGRLRFVGRADQQVKVSGYRIELGEIEAVLAEHAGVRQAVVAAETHPDAGTRLVAYVVARGADAPDAPTPGTAPPDPTAAAARVGEWQALWDAAYAAPTAAPRFNTSGWTRSDTGAPLPEATMREWLDGTVERLLALRPRRVLEIGCGTGMLLYRLLPHVEHYTACDVAPQALARIDAELRPDERARVALVEAAADAVEPTGPVDLVIVNSVAQYFPGGEYLRRVLERAVACVGDGGHVWVGDVRSLALLEAFHVWAELARSPDDAGAGAVRARVDRRVAGEAELAVDPAFFHALRAEVPRVAGVRARLKRGRDRNEMTRFRYDVVLDVGAARTGMLEGAAGAPAVPAQARRPRRPMPRRSRRCWPRARRRCASPTCRTRG